MCYAGAHSKEAAGLQPPTSRNLNKKKTNFCKHDDVSGCA